MQKPPSLIVSASVNNAVTFCLRLVEWCLGSLSTLKYPLILQYKVNAVVFIDKQLYCGVLWILCVLTPF